MKCGKPHPYYTACKCDNEIGHRGDMHVCICNPADPEAFEVWYSDGSIPVPPLRSDAEASAYANSRENKAGATQTQWGYKTDEPRTWAEREGALWEATIEEVRIEREFRPRYTPPPPTLWSRILDWCGRKVGR